MRTTLDISDDVLSAAKEMAQRDKKTLGQIVSELVRRGLNCPFPASADVSVGKDVDNRLAAMGFRTLPVRGGIVTNELINRLREQEGV